jgi:peroxiredoxin
MKFQISVILFVFLCAISACSQTENNLLKVCGTLTSDSVYQKIYLVNLNKKATTGAEAIIEKNGSFEMELEITGLEYFRLQLSPENYVIIVTVPGENIKVEVDARSLFQSLKVSGSPNSRIAQEMSMAIKSFDQQLNILGDQYQLYLKMPGNTAELELIKLKTDSVVLAKMEMVNELMLKYPESPSCLFYLNNLDIAKYLPTYIKVNDELYSRYPDNQYVRELNYTVTAEENFKVGKIAPDISLPDSSGKIIKLSSLRGKVVLVDFWASWCGPCRKENPNVVKAYRKYHDMGFDIYGVSLDNNRKKWVQAIEKDSLVWANVSDLKKWESEAAFAWAVRAIPYSVLLDKDGIIIAKKLRGGDLEKKLTELFDTELEENQ